MTSLYHLNNVKFLLSQKIRLRLIKIKSRGAMEKPRFEVPEEYKKKMTSYVEAAWGPSFFCFSKKKFDSPITVEEMLAYLETVHWSDKGTSIFLHEEELWLIFTNRKFSKVSQRSPKAVVEISGNKLEPTFVEID